MQKLFLSMGKPCGNPFLLTPQKQAKLLTHILRASTCCWVTELGHPQLFRAGGLAFPAKTSWPDKGLSKSEIYPLNESLNEAFALFGTDATVYTGRAIAMGLIRHRGKFPSVFSERHIGPRKQPSDPYTRRWGE